MKRILFSAMAALMLSLFSNNASAGSWRISSKPDAKANFTSINAAMSSADVLNGDTLYLDPGTVLQGTQTVKKSVTIIGTGYFLKDVSAKEAIIEELSVEASNVKVEGCYSINLSVRNGLDNVVIERCKIKISNIYSDNAKIYSCYIYDRISITGRQNVEISNCIILGYIGSARKSSITNNIILRYSRYDNALHDITNSKIANNIIINTFNGSNNVTIANASLSDQNMITNNVLSNDADHAFADYPDNKFIGAKPEDVFTMEGTADEQYRLKEDSPAKGYGQSGYDCGAYDGPFPYVVSGHPRFMPYIYDAIIPNQPTDGKLNVTLKIRTQNE